MNQLIRSRWKKMFGSAGVRRASKRWMACERLEGRDLFATNIWSKNGNGIWDVPGNWSLQHVPQKDEDVSINKWTVTVDSFTAEVKSLTTTGPLVVKDFNGWLKVSGTITQTGNATLTVQNEAWIYAGQIITGGSIQVQNSGLIKTDKLTTTGDIAAISNSVLEVNGPLKGNSLTVNSGAEIRNAVIDGATTLTVKSSSNKPALLNNVTANGPIDMGTSSPTLQVRGNLVLNNTATLGASAKLGFVGSQASLLGTGSVVLTDKPANGITTDTDGMTLTIGPSITIRGGNNAPTTSHIGGGAINTTLKLQGHVIADAGRTLRLGNLSNLSTPVKVILENSVPEVQFGNLWIDGNFDAAGADKFLRGPAGTISLVGLLDNSANLALSLPTMWALRGGTIQGGTIKQGTSTGFQFTSDRGFLNDVTIEGETTLANDCGFDVNGTLTYNGKLNIFGGGIWFKGAEASLLGQAKVSFVENSLTDSNLIGITDNMKLIIGPDVTITGGSNNGNLALIGSRLDNNRVSANNTTLEFRGKVLANVPGRTITVSPTGRLINNGTLEARGGTIVVGGTFTPADLGATANDNGTIINDGGIISIKGTLDNRNNSLVLDAIMGPWNLSGGTIWGGTIVETPDGILFTTGGGVLDAVTIEGNIDLSSSGQTFTVNNGLWLNGKANIGQNSSITFAGTQLLSGNATLDLAYRSAKLNLINDNATLTIDSSVLIKVESNVSGGFGSGIYSRPSDQHTTVVLNGTILSKYPNSVIEVDLNAGQAVGSGTLIVNGKIDAQAGEVQINRRMSRFTLPADGSINLEKSATLSMGTDFELMSQTADKVRLLGTTNFNGSALRLFDAPSKDLGPVSEGFLESNFLMGTLHVVNGTVLRLIDNTVNAGKDPTKKEAVYVNTLIVDANATFDPGGYHVYARSKIIKGTVMDSVDTSNDVIIVKGGGPLPFNVTVPATIDATQTNHNWTFAGRTGARITLDLKPVTTTFWAQLSLIDPTGKTVLTVRSASAGAVLTGLSNIDLTATGQYRVVVSADSAHPSSTGDYTITATDVTPAPRQVNVEVSTSQSSGADYGNSIEVTASVTPRAITVPIATGTIQFQLDGVNIGSPVLLVSGVARLTLTRIAAGARNITAVFISDNGVFDTKQSIFVQQVRKVILTVSAREVPSRVAGTPIELLSDLTGFVAGEGLEAVTGGAKLDVDALASNKAGTYTITVGLGTLTAANYFFRFTNAVMVVLPAAPARVDVVAGGDQSVKVNRSLPIALKLKVLDEYSNVVPGATVTFEAPSGSGTFAGGQSSVSVTTSSLGEAQAPAFIVSDQLGVYFIKATCNNVPPTNFKVTIRDAGLPLEFVPLPAVREGDGTVSITLQRSVINVPLTVNLSIDHPEFFTFGPSSVSFAVGEETKTWNATIVNDVIASALIGGAAKQILITASGAGLSATLPLIIEDDDAPKLTLQLPANLKEGEAETITIKRNTPSASELLVKLVSSDAQTLTVPETVTIPAGQDSVVAQVRAFTDQVAFGAHSANITITAAGLNSASGGLVIDDVDSPLLTLELLGRSDIEEGGTTLFRISRNTPTNDAMDVRLTTTNASLVEVPATVTIPPRASFVEFSVRATDDQLVTAAARTVTIKANATGFAEVARNVVLTEDDLPTLTLALDRSELFEGSSDTAFVTLTRNTVALPALNVSLVLEPSGRLLAPAVSFGAGENAAFFSLGVIDDHVFEGLQTIVITAKVNGFIDALDALRVIDNEKLKLAPKGGSTVSENSGVLTYTVTRDVTEWDTPLVVNLLSSDTGELSVPTTVIIPAHSASVDFNVSAIHDKIVDGTQSVQILASANAYTSASENVSVTDYEMIDVQLDFNSIDEHGGKVTATISRSDVEDLSQDLVIAVESSAPALLDFPNTVTIPAGQASIEILGTAQEINTSDKDIQVTLRFTAADYVAGQTQVNVLQVRFWNNARSPLDVNDDGSVTALDALLVINYLNTHPTQKVLGATRELDAGYVDTSANDFVTALDALLVINRLNNPTSSGEGEAVVDSVFDNYDLDNFRVEFRNKRAK